MKLQKRQIIINFCLLISLYYPLKLNAQTNQSAEINIPVHNFDNIDQDLSNPVNNLPSLIEENPVQPRDNILQTLPNTEETKCFLTNNEPINSDPINSFLVTKIEVVGNTVLDQEIHQLTNPFENRISNLQELFCLRSEITQLYLEHNYITSGAFLPQQEFTDGKIKIQIVEGEIENINVTGLTHLNDNYIRIRLENATTPPINLNRLQKALQLLQLNPLIQKITADLTAGNRSGYNILQLKVQEAPAFHTGIITANNRSPSIGEWETNFFIQHDNLIGFGDSFSANYGLTEGFDTYNFNYTIPINRYDSTMGINYSNSESIIIEKDFKDLDIRSESHNLSFNLNQPISKTTDSEFGLGLTLDLRQSQTFLLNNIPFSFSIGAENGQSKVTVLRFSQSWLDRENDRILAARSQFNLGLDAFDATINNTGTDGRFFSWLGQFQYVQQLSPSTVLLTSLNAQLTPDSLLSLEQFSIGGVDTVRGYRQNQLVADNGITGSISARINLTDNNNLQLTPFFEFGTAWNSDDTNSNFETIASLGLGFRWRIFNDFNVNINYGIPLIPVKNQSNSLQEEGLHFSFGYQPW